MCDLETIIEKRFQENQKLKFENQDYLVIIPKTQTDFEYEASLQYDNPIIKSWYEKHINGNVSYVFVRNKLNLRKPFIMCEIDNVNYEIVKCLYAYNLDNVTPFTCGFRQVYQNYLNGNKNSRRKDQNKLLDKIKKLWYNISVNKK